MVKETRTKKCPICGSSNIHSIQDIPEDNYHLNMMYSGITCECDYCYTTFLFKFREPLSGETIITLQS